MKPTPASFAVIAASALLAASGVQAAHQAPTRATIAYWDARHPPGLSTTEDVSGNVLPSLLAAAEGGDVEAMNLLGVLHVLGVQVPSDYSKAFHWFQRAIDSGSASAMHNLAQMYLYGVGVPRAFGHAFHWFQRSAAYGSVHSMYNAAVMAENGLGTSRDLRLSLSMYQDAAASGFAPAMVRVSDDLARTGSGKRGLVEAYAWLQVASQSELTAEARIVVFAKMEDLGSRLGPDRRNDAWARAAHIARSIKERAHSFAAAVREPIPVSPQTGRTLVVRSTELQV